MCGGDLHPEKNNNLKLSRVKCAVADGVPTMGKGTTRAGEKSVDLGDKIPADEGMSNRHLSDDLAELLQTYGESGFSLRELVTAFEERGYGLLLVVLALPSAMPVPAPGYSTPFGIILLLVGVQLALGRAAPWLPAWALDRRVSASLGRKMLGFGFGFFRRLEKWIRPRHEWMLAGGGRFAVAGVLLVMAALMTIPLPSTNTAPAIVIFLLGVGLIEKDGLAMVVALLAGVVAVLLYGFVLYLILHFGLQGIGEAKELIRGWFSRGG
jgi:hypothetical protein